MREPNQPLYPEELSQFLMAQAALLDAQPVKPRTHSFEEIQKQRMYEGVPIMPPEFQLMYPRRVRWSGWYDQPSGGMAHFSGSSNATPEQEAWHRINDPERGLHPHDLAAYRKSQRGPVARFFARLKFWPTKVKEEGEFEVPQWLRNMPD